MKKGRREKREGAPFFALAIVASGGAPGRAHTCRHPGSTSARAVLADLQAAWIQDVEDRSLEVPSVPAVCYDDRGSHRFLQGEF
jgi:hypothetical protein